MKERFLAVVNPVAGSGRCGKLAVPMLDRLRQSGLKLEIAQTSRPGEAAEIARQGYQQGYRQFLSVGGDGTSYEIVNGLFPLKNPGDRPALGFLPLGTGNSFLKDFSNRGLEHAIKALEAGRRRPCDVIRVEHGSGNLYFINLLSMGFAAEVAEITNRRFKHWGEFGYLLGVIACLARLDRRTFPLRADGTREWDRRRCLLLSFSNTKFTGGKMKLAPNADATDGWIEYVRWGPIGRLGLLWTLPRLFTGTHIRHRLASRQPVRRAELQLEGPVNVMVDGESLQLDCRTIEILPGALDVFV